MKNSGFRFCQIVLSLLLLPALTLAGCGPPDVKDYASFMENLEYAGVTVETERQDTESMTYAASYIDMFRHVLDSVEKTRDIEPSYYERETRRLAEIEEETGNFAVTFTDIKADGQMLLVNEYASEAQAARDAEFAVLADVPEFTVVVPTTTEEVTFMLQGIRIGTPHYYMKGRIIVLFIEMQSDPALAEGAEAMLDLLESLMGPGFYTS